MGNRLKNYIMYLDRMTSGTLSADESEKLMKDLLIQISFFQHERLIHLIVTALFALLAIITLMAVLILERLMLIILFLAFLALLIPYIAHYYRLENGVQRLYEFYDRLEEKIPSYADACHEDTGRMHSNNK